MDFDSKAAGTSAGSPDIKKGDNVAIDIERRSQAVGAEVHNTSHIGPQADVVGSQEVAGTITASRGTGFRSNGTPIEGVAITPTGPRRFTPRECERLQGIPDGFTAIKFGKKPASDAKRFHALGNSIAVPILIWIGQQITRAFTPDNSRTHAADGEGPPTTP